MCRRTRSASTCCREASTMCRRSTSNTIRRRCSRYIEEIEELLDHALGIGWGDGHGHRVRHRQSVAHGQHRAGHRHQGCGRRRRDVARTRAAAGSISSRSMAAIARICSSKTTALRRWPSATRRPIRSRRQRHRHRRRNLAAADQAPPDKPKPDPQKLAAMFTMELREARARHAAA